MRTLSVVRSSRSRTRAPKYQNASANAGSQSSKKAKATTTDDSDPGVSIILEKQVTLTFSLKYLSNFAKSAPLAKEVSLHMSNDVPLLVQFDFEQGSLQFFLAPKVCPLFIYPSHSSLLCRSPLRETFCGGSQYQCKAQLSRNQANQD